MRVCNAAEGLTGVFELLADHVVHEEWLADDLHLLHPLHALGDEQLVGEQEAVQLHLQNGKQPPH